MVDQDRLLEMIEDMCESYPDNFRGSRFFLDYTTEECEALVDFADQKKRSARSEMMAVVWEGISRLASALLENFRDVQEIVNGED